MRTHFTDAQRADPRIAEADSILRNCVHCGFCLTACPTYKLLGDESDSPRGRIVLMQNMLEKDAPPSASTVLHIDRCLSCLGCLTACPSGVDYQHLVDHAREHIEQTYRRPAPERWLRALLAFVLPRPRWFRAALLGAVVVRPLAFLLPGRLKRVVRAAPRRVAPPSPVNAPQVFPAIGPRRMRVALLSGCVQQVMGTPGTEATVRVLRRHGCEVVVAKGAGCCGALVHHMGRTEDARRFARAAVAAWQREADGGGLDAVVIHASGCGTTVRDYGRLLAGDRDWAAPAARIAALARDVTEVLAELGLQAPRLPHDAPAVAYHDSCSLGHGQRLSDPPRRLLREAGFAVHEVPDAGRCCGAAGTYNLLQPGIADALGAAKGADLAATGAAVVACGNLGCLVHLARFTDMPLMHTAELLDWATGGPRPPATAG